VYNEGSTEGGVVVRKIILVLAIIIAPVMAFADFKVGATAFYNENIMYVDSGNVADNLIYGLETRLKLWIFQLEADALYLDGEYPTIFVPTDLGISLDVWFMRFGLGLGPMLAYSGGSSGFESVDFWNMKATFDINIGSLTIGLDGMYFLDTTDGLINGIRDSVRYLPEIGVSVLIKLF
jgi:hypothetical protein